MKQLTVFLTVIIGSIFLFGCGDGGSSSNTSKDNRTGEANTNVAGSDNPLQTTAPTPEQTVNAAPTLSPMFKAYCSAMDKQDEAAIRKLYSSDTIMHFEKQMKAEGIKTLREFLENDKLGAKCEIRNEQIMGDTAVAEIRGDSYPNGIKAVFVKENGEWKITNKSPALDNMKPSTTGGTSSAAPAVNAQNDGKTGDKK